MTARAAFFSPRRGACPGLSAPMPTGDGLLVRLTPVGTISFDAFAALCAAAQRHGNGIVEITARGNIQVRGLSAASAPQFAATIAALDIAAEDGVPILCNPLTGIDPEEIIDAGALAAELRRALARTSLAMKLSPKISVIIDGSRTCSLEHIAADVRLGAFMFDGEAKLRVSVGGDGTDATQLGIVAPNHAIDAVIRLLEVLAARGREARARYVITAEGLNAFHDALSQVSTFSEGDMTKGVDGRDKPGHDGIGTHFLRDGSLACGVGLAFGHTDAATLRRLLDAARSAGASGLRAAPSRTLLVIGLERQTLPGFTGAAEALGFIVRAGDPRRHVVACAGAPICAAAEIAARALAPAVAAAAAPYLDDTFKIHISGCAKGCAHPAPAALTVVGTASGCAIVAGGSTRDLPLKSVPVSELAAAVTSLVREMKERRLV